MIDAQLLEIRPVRRRTRLHGAWIFIVIPILLVAVAANQDWRSSRQVLVLVALALSVTGIAEWRYGRRVRPAVGIAERIDDTLPLLELGRAREAADSYAVLAGESLRFPLLHAYALHNLGVAKIWLGEFEDAIACFDAIERSTCFKGDDEKAMRARLYCNSALCCALAGSFDSVEPMLAKIDSASIPGHRGEPTYVRAILALRRGQHAQAVALLRENWNELESKLSARRMRIVRVLTAFALDRIGAASSEIEPLLAGARPGQRGDFAFVTANWSELKDFLTQRAFTVELEPM